MNEKWRLDEKINILFDRESYCLACLDILLRDNPRLENILKRMGDNR